MALGQVLDDSPPILVAKDLSKSFGGRRVLDSVSFTVNRGEQIGLAGHNGSGKSTLVKILAGYHRPDPGGDVEFGHAADGAFPSSDRAGLSFVHQDLALVQEASVLENMCIAQFSTHRWGGIHWRKSRKLARSALDRLSIEVSLDTEVAALDPTTKALVAIARATQSLERFGSGVLVLDEPTAYLPDDGAARLFEVVRTIRLAGYGAILVSHDLTEVHRESDSLLVLRDGVCVYQGPTDDLPREELVALVMDAATIDAASSSPKPRRGKSATAAKRDASAARDPLLQVRDLVVGDVELPELTVDTGQIVGITGLLGSGFAAPLYAIFDGRARHASGHVVLNETAVELQDTSPAQMQKVGVSLIPADRLVHASAQSAAVKENVSLLCLDRITSRMYRLARSNELRFVEEALAARGLQAVNPDDAFSLYSGGTQQKMILAKWLATNPQLLLLDEPTHGIDVGACEVIYQEIRGAAAAGLGVLVASGDPDVLGALCDRVIVLRRGRVVSILDGTDVTAASIAKACSAEGEEASRNDGQSSGGS
jgi:ribose transport system ATP-binding protein